MLWNSGLKCGTYGGVYDIPTDTIYLCQEVEWDEEFYKYHEIWHHVWFKVLTQAQRDTYTKMYTRDLKKWKFYRDYARNSVIEDFADNWSLMALNIRQPYGIQKRINIIKVFMHDISK